MGSELKTGDSRRLFLVMRSSLLSGLALGLLGIMATGLGLAATSFPKPDPEHQFAELKVYDGPGRPWRAAIEDWPGARRRVAEDPVWVEWLKRERETVDRWSRKHSDRVEWIAGWSHDGVSPKD